MQIDFYGLRFEASKVIVYLWSPWRATALEHRLFNEVKQLPGLQLEQQHDELRIQIGDSETLNKALLSMSRLLKGWQEEATSAGKERRQYRWLIEGDTDEHGYDHNGDPSSVWCFLRLGLERGGIGEAEKAEDVDLDGFGLEITGEVGMYG